MAVKQLISLCEVLGNNTMSTVGDISAAVKFSLKRENLLETIRKQVDGKFNKLWITRWTIDATCFQKIIKNYLLLFSLWEESLLEKLDDETSARIKCCKSQMESFNFFFCLCFGQKLCGLTDNLSKTIKKMKTSAISGQSFLDHRNLRKNEKWS